MPPKDTQPYTLMFSTDGGETMRPLAKVTEVDLTEGCDDEVDLSWIRSGEEMEMTFTATTITIRNLILFLFGDKRMMPNNWLKMHWIPMRRRRK